MPDAFSISPLQGLRADVRVKPRALPWAILFRPFSPKTSSQRRALATVVILLLILSLGGCVHGPRRPKVTSLPTGAPEIQTILADLQAHNAVLSSLKIGGNIRLRQPGEKATQNFRGGTIQFQAPDQFLMRVRKGAFRMHVYTADDRFLLALPAEETFYFGREGERFDDILLDVAPSQLLRELFFLDTPGIDARAHTVLEKYVEAEETALLAVYAPGHQGRLKQRLRVKNVDGWRITEVSVFNETGALLAHTICESYKTIKGVLVPATVTAYFPLHDAEMGYRATKFEFRLKSQAPLPMETIEEARTALLAKGYQEVVGTS